MQYWGLECFTLWASSNLSSMALEGSFAKKITTTLMVPFKKTSEMYVPPRTFLNLLIHSHIITCNTSSQYHIWYPWGDCFSKIQHILGAIRFQKLPLDGNSIASFWILLFMFWITLHPRLLFWIVQPYFQSVLLVSVIEGQEETEGCLFEMRRRG